MPLNMHDITLYIIVHVLGNPKNPKHRMVTVE